MISFKQDTKKETNSYASFEGSGLELISHWKTHSPIFPKPLPSLTIEVYVL